MIDSEVTKRRDIILDDDISKNQYLKSILPFDGFVFWASVIGTLEILDYKVYDGVKCTKAG